MRIRFVRRPPLFRGGKSTKLSPFSADKPLDCAEFSRMTPAARIRPISARRASDDMRSGHRGLGPEIGVFGLCDMATFRDWDDAQKVSRNQENTSFSVFCGQYRPVRSAAQICARSPSPPMADSDCSGRESARVAAHELVECVECRLFLELGHLPPRRRAVWIEQQ